jgi:quercetin dioxygenase-like cupin family protein
MSQQKTKTPGGAVLQNVVDAPWFCGPGHSPNAFSKRLAGPADGSSRVGYVLSSYAPGHYMEPHTHKVREQVYHILEGEGVLVIDGVRHRVGPHDVAFLPPGVSHGLYNEGLTNLVFVIASGPAEDK